MPLPPVNPSDIKVTSREMVALSPNTYGVSISYNFIYNQPDTVSLRYFEVWLNESLAPSDIQITRVGAMERSVFVQDTVQSSNGTFDVYLQVRMEIIITTDVEVKGQFWGQRSTLSCASGYIMLKTLSSSAFIMKCAWPFFRCVHWQERVRRHLSGVVHWFWACFTMKHTLLCWNLSYSTSRSSVIGEGGSTNQQ